MATRIEDPELGTLIKIEEASSLTGIPKPTLRLWRREQYRHLAKFDEYTHESSNATWYRLADIEGWLIANGKDPKGNRTMFTKAEAPNAFRAPLNAPLDPKKHEALAFARKITRHNQHDTLQKIFKTVDHATEFFRPFGEKYLPALTEYWFKGEEPKPFVNAFPSFKGMYPAMRGDQLGDDFERAAFIRTNMVRLIDAEINGRELSVDDVVVIPV